MKNDTIVIVTRSSKLALWQADYVADCLRKRYPELRVEKKLMTTKGDKILDAPLAKIGGKGLFTKELEQEMLEGGIDIAVHSLKDMPTEVPEGLVISAITERFDPGDAVVSPKYKTLENLPQGAKVGTSSLRRASAFSCAMASTSWISRMGISRNCCRSSMASRTARSMFWPNRRCWPLPPGVIESSVSWSSRWMPNKLSPHRRL